MTNSRLSAILKCVSKLQFDYINKNHPLIKFCSNGYMNWYKSFSIDNRKDICIRAEPIPDELIYFKNKIKSVYNIDFNSVTIEKYSTCHDTHWNSNVKDYLMCIFLHPNKDNIQYKMKHKTTNKVKTLTVRSFDTLFKKHNEQINWDFQICTPGTYVIYFHNYVEKTQHFDDKKIDKSLYLSRLSYYQKCNQLIKSIQYILPETKSFHATQKSLQLHNISFSKISNGSWGEVYKSVVKMNSKTFSFVTKLSKVDKKYQNDIKMLKPHSDDLTWHEHILFKRLHKRSKKCPNLPIYINTFFVKSHKFNLLGENDKLYAGIATCMELANQDLKTFLKQQSYIQNDLIVSIMFQVCVAVMFMHNEFQNINRDIKPSNVLVLKTSPGGVWKYTIRGTDYFVPNLGVVCLLTDFGVSYTYNPNINLSHNGEIKLGTRIGIHDKKNKTILPFVHKDEKLNKVRWKKSDIQSFPINTHFKVINQEFKPEKKFKDKIVLNSRQKNILKQNGISVDSKEFYSDPYIVILSECYTDIQDVFRMFCNFKLEQCNTRKKKKLICVPSLCETCAKSKNRVKQIYKCEKCSYICKKCSYSSRMHQRSFFSSFESINHSFVRGFVKPILLHQSGYNKLMFSLEPHHYIMEEAIKTLFAPIFSNPEENVIETYLL